MQNLREIYNILQQIQSSFHPVGAVLYDGIYEYPRFGNSF